ncbi:phosphoribosyltransferase [Micromonospora sp. HM5-17]|uniref:phosphoribosyltransferase n=1 Tax=Micromonospora sp. HM5-17 TaxID=2487710 RepID=UPI000F4974B9|nr:phosphoribosyltransferase family protein [Micromonospora sp. HM5-17]ROT33656.1 phosphoribosyltransferase [Micromonospora sp. HM5-17]
MDTTYRDRAEAGATLADRLGSLANRSDVIVLGLVRGGVPVAAAVAERLAAPLDVLVVRKLGVPMAPELAFGAVGPGGVRVLNEEIAERLEPDEVEEVVRAETAELRRREERYRGGRPPLRLDDRIAVVVDDGLATGATARAAVGVARKLGARRVVVAVPVGAPESYDLLARTADEVVCPLRPAEFGAVSRYYEDFHEVSDDEVVAALTGSG